MVSLCPWGCCRCAVGLLVGRGPPCATSLPATAALAMGRSSSSGAGDESRFGWRMPYPDRTVEELVAVERRCCPFFALDWDPSNRQLRVSVAKPGDEPALAAIADALGMSTTATRTG